MIRLLSLVLGLALLTACASSPPVVQDTQPLPEPEAPPAEPVEKPFPDDSLYPLLVAEFALRRQAFDVALENYLQQSRVLHDAGISSHTTHLAQYMQRDEEALEAVQLWLELEPDNVEANSTAATLLMRQKRPIEALPHLTVVARHGQQANFPGLLNGFTRLEPAFEQYDSALAKLDAMFQLEPYQQQALSLEARILVSREASQPFARLEQALNANPEDKQLRLQYARLLTNTDIAAARQQFEILSAQSPQDGDLLLSLALINREIGDDLEAKAYLRQMLAVGQRLNEAHYYLGRIAQDNEDLEEAVSHYMQVEDGRDFLSANQRIGRILINAGQVERNQEWFKQQRDKHPQRREQLYGLEADLLTSAGALQASMLVLNLGLAELPDSTSLRYARSMLGEQQGDLALMESDLRVIIAADPDNATALNALGYTLANRTDRYSEAFELISHAGEHPQATGGHWHQHQSPGETRRAWRH
jgi:tetratricopeptide (TPR) repeat protein